MRYSLNSFNHTAIIDTYFPFTGIRHFIKSNIDNMYKSKFIDFLRTLSKDEMKRFGDFVSSPYYNKTGNLVKLFDELKNHYPDFLAPAVAKNKLYKKLFPGKKYNEQVMKNMSSQLLKLAKEFLCAEFYGNNHEEKKINLLRQLSTKKLDSVFNSELRVIEKEFTEIKNLTDPIFFYLYRMELERVSFMLMRDKQQKVPESILLQGEYLIYFFLMQLSISIGNIRVNEDSFNAKFESNLVSEFVSSFDFEKLMKYILKNDEHFGPIVYIHYCKMMCSLNPDKENFYYELKKAAVDNINKLNKYELYNIFTVMESYCIMRANRNKTHFYDELFENYKIALEHNILIIDEPPHITAMKFRNIYSCAFIKADYDWVENYINEYGKYLTEDSKELAELARAQLSFFRKEYDNSLEILQQINPDLHFAKLDMRVLTIQIYYERDYLESALSSLNSFRQFINNNEHIVEHAKIKCLNFINITTNLVKLKTNPDRKKLSELEDRINTEPIRSYEWLMEKIVELSNVNKSTAKSA